MRGPEGPVRSGVTRCGRPSPQPRGKGEKSSPHPPTREITPLPWIVGRETFELLQGRRGSSLRPAEKRGMRDPVRTRTIRRKKVLVIKGISPGNPGMEENSKKKLLEVEKVRERSRVILRLRTEEEKRRIKLLEVKNCSRNRKALRLRHLVKRFGVLRRVDLGEKLAKMGEDEKKRSEDLDCWHCLASCSDCCLDIGGLGERKLLLADKNIALEWLKRGTERCAESRFGHPRSRFIWEYLMLLHPLDRYGICLQLHQHPGEVSNSPIVCPLLVPKNPRKWTLSYRKKGAFTLRRSSRS